MSPPNRMPVNLTDIVFIVVDAILGLILLLPGRSFDSLVEFGLATLFLVSLRILVDLREPKSFHPRFTFDEGLLRSQRSQAGADHIRVVSANREYTSEFVRYVDETLASASHVARVIDPENLSREHILDHMRRTWPHLVGNRNHPPKYSLYFAPTGNVGSVVVDRRFASFFIYTGNPNQCLYIESDLKEVVNAAESRFEFLTDATGPSHAVRFPAGDSPPSAFDSAWASAWLDHHGVRPAAEPEEVPPG